MIDPKCSSCGVELSAPAALLITPPDDESNVKKLHLCTEADNGCFERVVAFLDGQRMMEYR